MGSTKGSQNHHRSDHHEREDLDQEFMSDMSLKIFTDYICEDQMSRYLRQKPKVKDYREACKVICFKF